MLSKQNRLSTREFAFVIDKGKEIRSPFFTIKYVEADCFKFSPVAPKKTFKTAVLRNQTRRRVYAAAREIFCTKQVKQHMIALIVKKDIREIDSPRLVHELVGLFVKARLIK